MYKPGDIITIEELPDKDYILCCDSQDTKPIKENIPFFVCDGDKIENDFDSFFVLIGDGDYLEVWGYYGYIPVIIKETTLILG
jgi:hypothetical protein